MHARAYISASRLVKQRLVELMMVYVHGVFALDNSQLLEGIVEQWQF